jgi:hypothetical protein
MSKGNLAIIFVVESMFWLVSYSAAQDAEYRTWADRSGGHQVRAQLVEFKDGQVKLKKEDGGTVSLPVDNLSDADRVWLCGPDVPKTPPGASGPQVKVVATGVGMDGEMALKNAFSHAIEQAVGVLVDAETIVDNDQLIRDQVLTFTRGVLQQYAVTGRWQEEGLWHVRIWALVSVNPLSEKLTAQNITVRQVPGELLWGQAVVEIQNESQAAEIFARAMRDFGIDKLVKVEIVGEPDAIEKNPVTAKLRVRVRLTPDFEKWQPLHRNLEPILKKIASASASFATVAQPPNPDAYCNMVLDKETDERLIQTLQGEGGVACLFKEANRTGTATYWQAFRVPAPIKEELDRLALRKYDLRVCLADAAGNTLVQHEHPLEDLTGNYNHTQLIDVLGRDYRSNLTFQADYLLAPLIFSNSIFGGRRLSSYRTQLVYEENITLQLDQLRALNKVSAEILERTRP